MSGPFQYGYEGQSQQRAPSAAAENRNCSSRQGRDPEKLFGVMRDQLLERGVNGIKAFGRLFRIWDRGVDDRKLDLDEFKYGCMNYGLSLGPDDLETCFMDMDKTGDGRVDYNEFIARLRPPMSKCRLALIEKAFEKMDRTKDGIVTIDDLKGAYVATEHPKYKSGEWSKTQVFTEFLKSFQVGDEVDDKITREEFISYYAGVSHSIDRDVYFDYMMRQCWKL